MVNRKTVVLNVGGDLAEVPLLPNGNPLCCWLVQPLSNFGCTKLFPVEKITTNYVWIYADSHRRRIDREWLANSPWVAAVKDTLDSKTVRFYGSAVKGGYCVAHLDDKPLPDDMIGFSQIVGPDSHRRVWEICHSNHDKLLSIWPIEDNIVSLHRRGWPESMTHIHHTVFDLFLICCGFVDGYDAVYAGE